MMRQDHHINGFSSFAQSAQASAGAGLNGTAPQVVEEQPYPGELLADEGSRVIGDDGGDVGSVTCSETPVVSLKTVTDCHGLVDGRPRTLTVTFQDSLGHFTLVEH